jgi:hypothetical protein
MEVMLSIGTSLLLAKSFMDDANRGIEVTVIYMYMNV